MAGATGMAGAASMADELDEDRARDSSSVDAPPDGRPGWAAHLVRRGPWGHLAERWVPESLQGARVSPGRRGAAVLSVVAALAAVVAAVGVWWGRPDPAPVTPVALPPAAGSDASTVSGSAQLSGPASGAPAGSGAAGGSGSAAGPGAAAGVEPAGATSNDDTTGGATRAARAAPMARTASTAPAGPILVSVTGQVRHPGVVSVPPDARVADAIAAAGGALDPADLTGLNLAAHLSDGDSVVVAGPDGSVIDEESPAGGGMSPVAGTQTTPSGTAAPIDLNHADEAALETLPGVGPVTAAAILAWRTDHGPFTSVDQLQAIPGIGPATYAQIAPHVTI